MHNCTSRPFRLLAAWLVLGLVACDRPPDGFRKPESILHDEKADVYLVSNIHGKGREKDGNGFISRLSPDQSVLELQWIDGRQQGITLHAPKGMALSGDSLYVADIDSVRVFDRVTGQPQGSIRIDGTNSLNDVAADREGIIYVSDSGPKTDAIYRIEPGEEPEKLASGPTLGRPNGLVADSSGVTVAALRDGQIYHLDHTGSRTEVRQLPQGGLDGLARLEDGSLVISSKAGQAIYRLAPAGEVTTLLSDIPDAADIAYDRIRNRLLIPRIRSNRIEILPLSVP